MLREYQCINPEQIVEQTIDLLVIQHPLMLM